MNKTKAQAEYGLAERKIDSNVFQNWEQAKDQVVLQLVNYEKNKKLLKSIPYMQYFDLALIFLYYIGLRDEKMVTSIVQNHDFEEWGITINELYDVTLANSVKLLQVAKGRLEHIVLGG